MLCTFSTVNQMNAGKADIGVTVNGPRGSSVPFDVYSSSQGHRITYNPKERGSYQIYVTFGGHSVPGSHFYLLFYLTSCI